MDVTSRNIVVIGKNAYTPLVEGNGVSIGSFVEKLKKSNVSELPPEVWCVDYPASVKDWAILLRQPKRQRSLIRYEPSVVLPRTHNRTYLKLFSNLVDVGRAASNEYQKVSLWPQTWGEMNLSGESRNPKKIVVINGDKLSFVNGELYSLRRRCLLEIDDLDLFGHGWDRPSFDRIKVAIAELAICVLGGRFPRFQAAYGWFAKKANYLGPTLDKRGTLAKYKYSLVIENSGEFLTEKLFDCLFSGTIPIYVGPKIEQFRIPHYIAIQVEPSVKAIRQGINTAANIDHKKWLEQANVWLSRDETRRAWSSESVFQEIFTQISANGAK